MFKVENNDELLLFRSNYGCERNVSENNSLLWSASVYNNNFVPHDVVLCQLETN